MKIVPGDLTDQQVRDLVRSHLAGMHENSPPGSVFALDLSGLDTHDVSFYTAWEGQALLGIGALRQLSPNSGEIKSMRTHASHLRKGVAAALLEHMIAEATRRGYCRLSLETGSGPSFDPAVALYSRYGFVIGPAFAEYEKSDFNQFMHLNV